MRLAEIVKSISSKNAGNFHLTFDIIFDDRTSYIRVRDSGVLSADSVATVCHIPPEMIERVIYFDVGNAIKVTMRRSRPSGDPGETDVFGAQQYPPLLEIEIPDRSNTPDIDDSLTSFAPEGESASQARNAVN